MNHTLTIVMYHYVRDLKKSRYPEIKGLDVELFKEQIAHIQKHYVVVHPNDVIAAATGKKSSLPANAALLTFDDGYADHFTYVLPILMEHKLSGMFFPVVKTITERKVLDINKVHFALASLKNTSEAINIINQTIDEHRDAFDLDSNEEYYRQHAVETRFDTADIQFIKRLTQFALPPEVREVAAHRLFENFVTVDETAFAEELYLRPDQLKAMLSCGMYVGSHSTTHPWLNKVSREKQEEEIDHSLSMLKMIGAATDNWVMCYPSGAYDDSTLDILRSRNCAIGLTTRPDIANFQDDDPLQLPRLDTNDLPKNAVAPPNEWTQKVINS